MTCGVRVTHVKPHGALYNQATQNREVSEAIVKGVARWNRNVVLVGLAGSLMFDVFKGAGFKVAAEAFADRRYEPDGNLRSRKLEGALICDPAEAGQQALRIVQERTVTTSGGTEIAVNAHTLCLHGDTPGSPRIAAAVAQTLKRAGFTLSAFSHS